MEVRGEHAEVACDSALAAEEGAARLELESSLGLQGAGNRGR